MADQQIDEKQDQAPKVIRLREAIAFYDALPAETKKKFRKTTKPFARHFGPGMFLRNALLSKHDIRMLAWELWIVTQEVEKGNCRLIYTQIAEAADRRADSWFMTSADFVSGRLMDVLEMRDEGKLEIGELN